MRTDRQTLARNKKMTHSLQIYIEIMVKLETQRQSPAPAQMFGPLCAQKCEFQNSHRHAKTCHKLAEKHDQMH